MQTDILSNVGCWRQHGTRFLLICWQENRTGVFLCRDQTCAVSFPDISLGPVHTGLVSRFARKPLDVAWRLCEHSYWQQCVPLYLFGGALGPAWTGPWSKCHFRPSLPKKCHPSKQEATKDQSQTSKDIPPTLKHHSNMASNDLAVGQHSVLLSAPPGSKKRTSTPLVSWFIIIHNFCTQYINRHYGYKYKATMINVCDSCSES